MNVEDSYEGALRRLQRLEMAGVVAMQQAPAAAIEQAARDSSVERMRELEELATLACEENERLEGELDGARQEVEGARRELEGARRELEGARRELEQLRGQVASLRQAAANAPQPMFASAAEQAFASTPEQAFAPAPEQAFAPAASPFAPAASPFAPAASPFAPAASPFAPSPFANDASFDDELDYPPKSGRGALYFFLVALAGAGIVTLFVTRPWERPRSAPIVVEPAAPAPPPVVTAPPAPKAEPAVPKIAPTVPKLAPTVPKLAPTIPKTPALAAHGPRATKARPARKHAKHHAAKKHGAAKSRDAAPANDDDPLGGTGL